MSPRQDDNAPDLYIPLMAFVTYVLAAGEMPACVLNDAGFWLGVVGQFTPEILGRTLSSCMVVWTLEVAAWFGSLTLGRCLRPKQPSTCYTILQLRGLMWSPSQVTLASSVDHHMAAGYKYVSAVCNLAAFITFGR